VAKDIDIVDIIDFKDESTLIHHWYLFIDKYKYWYDSKIDKNRIHYWYGNDIWNINRSR